MRFRRWKGFFHLGATFLVLALVVVGIVYTLYSLQMPYLGAGFKQDAERWVVEYADPGGLAYDLGVRPGDVVTTANGRPISEVAGSSDHLHHSTIKQATVVLSSGKQVAFKLTNTGPLGTPKVAFVAAVCILGIGVVFLLAAIAMAFKGSSQIGVSGLGLLSAFLGLTMITNQAAARGILAAFQVQALSMLLASALFWHLVYFFPPRKLELPRAALSVSLSYLSTLILFLPLLVVGANGSAFPIIRSLILLHILFWCGLSVGRLWWTYHQPGLERFRAQVRIVGTVCGVALLPLLLFSILPEIANLPWNLLPQASLVPTAAVPLVLGVVASRARLYEYDKVVSRSLVYATVAFLVFAAQGLLAFFVVRGLWHLGPLPVSLAIGLISATLLPTLEVVRRWTLSQVDRYVYRIGADLTAAILHFRAVLSSHETAKEISELMPDTVANVLNLEQAYFIPQPLVGVVGPIWSTNRKRDEVLVSSVYRVRVGETLLGLLALGPKVSGADLTREEKDFVETVTTEGALGLLRLVQVGAAGGDGRILPPGA